MSVRRRRDRDPVTGVVKEVWMVDVVFEHADGRVQRIRKVSPIQTRRDAEAYERELRQSLLTGARDKEVARAAVPTVAAFEKEFITHAEANDRPSWVIGKKKAMSAHIVPMFGAKQLHEIGPRDLERFKAALKKKSLAPKSVKTYLGVLLRMLRLAKKWGVIEKVPEVDPVKVPPPEFRFFTAEESARLVQAADPEWRCMILTALRTGLRLGELLALRWEDVDLVAKRIIVRRSDWRGNVGPTKTGRNREVPLGDEVLAALKSHRGLKHLKGGLVFAAPDGNALRDPECRRPLERACRKAGLDPVGWHVLRHSFASQLTMAGAPLKSVAELLGHSTIQMTMRYAHLSPEARREAVLLLDSKQAHGTIAARESTNPANP